MSAKSKLCNRWKDSATMKAGIEHVVSIYVARARMASRDAARALKQDRQGSYSAFHNYLRYRAERQHWIHAAKQLLYMTTNGVVHWDVAMRQSTASLASADGGAK